MLHHGGKITLMITGNEFQHNIKQPYFGCHIEFVKYSIMRFLGLFLPSIIINVDFFLVPLSLFFKGKRVHTA